MRAQKTSSCRLRQWNEKNCQTEGPRLFLILQRSLQFLSPVKRSNINFWFEVVYLMEGGGQGGGGGGGGGGSLEFL